MSPTDAEEATIHILTTRAEVDLPILKSEFKNESKKSLEEIISSDTSTVPGMSTLRQFLLTIISPEEATGFTPRTSAGSGTSFYMSPLSSRGSACSQNDSYNSGSVRSSGSFGN